MCGEINVWYKTDGEKEDRGCNKDVGLEETMLLASDGKGKWSEMVRACVDGMMGMF